MKTYHLGQIIGASASMNFENLRSKLFGGQSVEIVKSENGRSGKDDKDGALAETMVQIKQNDKRTTWSSKVRLLVIILYMETK